MRYRRVVKLGLVGLLMLAATAFAAAQLAAPDRVLLLQAKRFEGSFRLPGGETVVRTGDANAQVSVNAGPTSLTAALAPMPGRPTRATLTVGGKTIEGRASIDGRTLNFEFSDGPTVYRIRLTLTGRNDGDLTATKGDQTLVSGALKRV